MPYLIRHSIIENLINFPYVSYQQQTFQVDIADFFFPIHLQLQCLTKKLQQQLLTLKPHISITFDRYFIHRQWGI